METSSRVHFRLFIKSRYTTMRSLIRIFILMLTTAQVVYGQLNNPLSQYNQLPYLQNAAFSGITGHTDIKAGFKKQWATFNGSPRSYLLGVDHVFGENVNSGHAYNEVEMKPSQRSIKVG